MLTSTGHGKKLFFALEGVLQILNPNQALKKSLLWCYTFPVSCHKWAKNKIFINYAKAQRTFQEKVQKECKSQRKE